MLFVEQQLNISTPIQLLLDICSKKFFAAGICNMLIPLIDAREGGGSDLLE